MMLGNLIFTVILFLISCVLLISTISYPFKARLFPMITLSVALALLIVQIFHEFRALKGAKGDEKKGEEEAFSVKHLAILLWLLVTVVMLWVLGFMGTVVILPFVYLRFYKESWILSISIAVGCGIFFYGVFGWGLHMNLYPGIILPKIF